MQKHISNLKLIGLLTLILVSSALCRSQDSRKVVKESSLSQPVENQNTGEIFATIQNALTSSNDGDTITLAPGVYQESIDLTGKNITLRSTNPDDPNITTQTILEGDGDQPVISLNNNTSACRIAGLTIRNGSTGIYCDAGNPRIEACQIIHNAADGIELLNKAEPTVSNCIIAVNQGAGIRITPPPGPTRGQPPQPLIINCTIVQNNLEGIKGDATVTNSIIYFNNDDPNGLQITSAQTVTYSDVQGGHEGSNNMDTDPFFVSLGYFSDTNDPNTPYALWINGDYHLQSQAGRIDPNGQAWTSDEITSCCIDAGNPNDSIGLEPAPNGGRINIGAYGGTTQASKTKQYLTFLWETPALLRTPESVVYDRTRDMIYVSNFNIRGGFLQGDNQSFDEFISKVNTNGEIEQLQWVTGLNAPTGLTIFEDKLFVIERGALVEIDIEAGRITNRYSIPNSNFPNDVVFDSNGIGYISDSGNVTIHRFANGVVEPWIYRNQMSGLNGLCVDQDRVVGFDSTNMYFKGARLSDGQVENILHLNLDDPGGLCDGLRMVNENTYIISDFNGIVYLASKTGCLKQILDITNTPPVAGPRVSSADIEYIPEKKMVVIPTFYDHRLLAYELHY